MQQWLLQLDPSCVLDATGLRSNRLGVGVYVPSAVKAPNDPVEGVIAFDGGYYERYSQ